MPRHPLNALLRLIAITYREKFCTYLINNKIILISYYFHIYKFKEQIRYNIRSYGGG